MDFDSVCKFFFIFNNFLPYSLKLEIEQLETQALSDSRQRVRIPWSPPLTVGHIFKAPLRWAYATRSQVNTENCYIHCKRTRGTANCRGLQEHLLRWWGQCRSQVPRLPQSRSSSDSLECVTGWSVLRYIRTHSLYTHVHYKRCFGHSSAIIGLWASLVQGILKLNF